MDITKESKRERDERKSRQRSIRKSLGIIVFLALIIALIFGLVWVSSRSDGGAGNLGKVAPITEGDHVKGATTSPKLVLVEYSDFQCPACAGYEPTVRKLVSTYADRGLVLVYRHFPLAQHNKATLAAKVTEAASTQGKFWEMHDLIFDNQEKWAVMTLSDATDLFTDYAKTLNLDLVKFVADIEAKATIDKIQSDLLSGKQAGVIGTPTFYLNGRYVEANTDEEFEALFEKELVSIQATSSSVTTTFTQ